jgi:hypothetical protein
VLNVPPSPLLSARNISNTYLKVTIIVSDQMMRDRVPRRSARLGGLVNVEENT